MRIIRYRQEIDGLRALAVVPVVMFHLGFKWIHGGFVGVDVFFVISGYLISLIILREQQQGQFTITSFWARRARRILPALSSMVLATMIAGVFIFYGSDLKSVGAQGLSVFALLANVKMMKLTGGYWAPTAHDTPLLHTWSLAVEEQFYLIFPLLLVTILRYFAKHAFKLVLAGTLLSFLLSLFATYEYPNAAFYLLPTRAWEMAAGCLLALISNNRPDGFVNTPPAPMLSCAGVIIIVASCLFISGDRGFPGYQALFPVIGTLLVIAYAGKTHLAGRILSCRPISYIGKLSYSLYLWHWPVIVYAYAYEKRYGVTIYLWFIVPLILALSMISYHFVEKPARFGNKWAIPVASLTLTSIAASLGLSMWQVNYDFSNFAPVVWNGRLYDVTPMQKPWEGSMKERMTGIVAPLREHFQADAFQEQGIVKQYGTTKPEVIVFGDSHALMWSSTIESICRDLGATVSFFAADGTSPEILNPPRRVATPYFTAEEKFLFDGARLRSLRKADPALVIISCKWSDIEDITTLEYLVGLIGRNNSKVMLIEQPPVMPFGDRNALIYCAATNTTPSEDPNQYLSIGDAEKWRSGRKLIESLAKKYSFCSLVLVSDIYLNKNNKACLKEMNHLLYIDDDHLSDYGATKSKARIKTKITELLATNH